MPAKKRKRGHGKQTTIGEGVVESKQQTAEAIRPPQGSLFDHHSRLLAGKIPITWDETYTEIIQCIENGLGRNAIAERIDLARSSVTSRLGTLERLGLITKRKESAQTLIGGCKNIYVLTRRWSNLLGSTEEAPPRFEFDGAHNWAFKFKILKGEVPKSDRKVRMNNWDFYVFAADNLDWSIQVNDTNEPSFIVFPQVDLGKGTVGELQQKYSNYAWKIAQFFQYKYRIAEIGLPELCREQHFERRDDPLAKAIKAMFGDLRTPSVRADNTPQKNTLEIVGAERARAVEWTVTEMPKFAAYAEREFREIKTAILRIEEQLEHIPKEKVYHFLVEKPVQEPQPTLAIAENPTPPKGHDPMYG